MTTLKVLAKEKNVEVVEYFEVQYTKDVFIDDSHQEDPGSRKEYSDHLDNQSQQNQIKSFLSQSNTFFKKRKRLLVIKEFPSTMLNDPDKYYDLWTWYHAKFSKKGVPIVFICTTDNGKDTFINRIFSKQMKEDLNLDTINFNPPTKKQMISWLCKKMDSKVSTFDIESVISDERCDFRSVINSVNLKFGDKLGGSSLPGPSSKRQRTYKSPSTSISDRDQAINIHHFIARILYAKRHFKKFQRSISLPKHLKQFERTPLDRDPFLLVESCPLENTKLTLYLLENYLTFCQNLECASSVTKWLSLADILQGDTADATESLEVYRNSLIIAGTMFDLRPTDVSNPKKFGIVSNQNWHRFQRNSKDAKDELQAKCYQYRAHTPNELLYDILPYLSVMKGPTSQMLKKKYGKPLLNLTIFKSIDKGGFSSSREPFRSFKSTDPLVDPLKEVNLIKEENSDEDDFIIECSEESD